VHDHVDHAGLFVEALSRQPKCVLDLGSGGGVPALILAFLWPEAQFSLLEVSERRTAFLRNSIIRLALGDRLTVLEGRAEELGRAAALREQFDVVTARSFASPAVTAECGSAYLQTGGNLLVSEPPTGSAQRWPADGLKLLGLTESQTQCQVASLEKIQPLDSRYPRRVGVPAKRPLW